MPLKKSIVLRETQILNNLIIYLEEHEADIEIKEDDPNNFRKPCRVLMLISGLIL